MHTVYCAITSEFLFAYTGCYSIFRISQTRAQRLRAPQESGMQINHQRIHATRQDLLLEDREAGSKTASRREPVTLHTHCTKTATGTGSDSRTIPRIKDRPTRELTPVRLQGQKPRASSGNPGWGLGSSGGMSRTRADSRSPFVGGYGSVRRAHFRSYTSRTRKLRVKVVKSLDSR